MESSEGQAELFQLRIPGIARLAWIHQASGPLLVLHPKLHDRFWATLVSDKPDEVEGLEHIWMFIRMRFGYEQASKMQEHFETHVREDSEVAAYQCLIRNFFGVMESLNLTKSVHTFPAKWLLKFAIEENNEGDG